MISCGKLACVLTATSLSLSCVDNSTKPVSEAVCEEILASFSIVATTFQSSAERYAMLKTIKTLQEDEYAKPCAEYPNWTARFEDAYRRAL